MTTAFDAKKVKTGICRFKSKCHRPPVSTDSRRLDVSSAVRSRHATRTPLFSPSRFTHLFPSFLSRLSNAFLSFPFASRGIPARFTSVLGKPTVFRVSLFPPFSPSFFLSMPRVLSSRGTFTRSLNRANDKRLFRLYRWLTELRSNNYLVGPRVQRVLRYRIFDYD